MVREWCALYILTSKCASRHNGVHFFDISTSKSGPNPWCFNILTSKCASRHNGVQLFISHLPRCLCTRRFSEPTFQPSGATKPRKNTVFRDFPNGSLTSKLPSMNKKIGSCKQSLQFHGYFKSTAMEKPFFLDRVLKSKTVLLQPGWIAFSGYFCQNPILYPSAS